MFDNIRRNMMVAAYAILLATIVAASVSFCYFKEAEPITRIYGGIAAIGHFFVLLWLILGVPTLIFSALIRSERAFKGYLVAILSVCGILLAADIIVYSQYRFHINGAIVDMFFNAGDTISFSAEMWMQIVGIAIGIATFALAIVFCSIRIAEKGIYLRKLTGAFMGLFIVAEFVYMVAFATYRMDLIVVKNYIPLFQPLTANRLLTKLGIKPQESPTKLAKSVNNLNYPINKPVFSKKTNEKPKNIIFLMADSLRADILNKEVMPKTWEWAQNKIILNQHYASSSGTRLGIFGLFYSLPPTYWHSVLTTRTPPVFITSLQKMGYDVQAFATATLVLPEFSDTVFTTVRPLRLESKGTDSIDKDINSIEDFEAYLKKRESEGDTRPFFAFIFLDSTHAYAHPEEFKRFEPAWDNPNYLKLTNDTDPVPFMNLYKNSAAWVDELFGRTLGIIDKHGLMDNSIIMVSTDHGQEINDSKKNFWGHSIAYTEAQTRIPGVIHWPGKSAYVENNLTVAYDIPITILRHELGMTTSLEDVGIGYDLFEGKLSNRKWFIMGSYSNVAIREKDRLIEIDELGLLKFYDSAYNKHSNTQRTANIMETFDLMSKYRKH